MSRHAPALEPGQESVWDYPRPPRLEPAPSRIRIEFAGIVLADTRRSFRVLETSHPPVYYLPPGDIAMEHLVESPRSSFCEWKGRAAYFSVVVGANRLANVAWYYPKPAPGFEPLRDHVAFYPSPMDGCFIDGERVEAQPGDFYGGWITSKIVGPFKGNPGTLHW